MTLVRFNSHRAREERKGHPSTGPLFLFLGHSRGGVASFGSLIPSSLGFWKSKEPARPASASSIWSAGTDRLAYCPRFDRWHAMGLY